MFSTLGIGKIFAKTFDQIASECIGYFPNGDRGSTIMVAADYSGSHKGQAYETYSFLLFDLHENVAWLSAQRDFRRWILPSRRMSFKALNDERRRAAIVPFLQSADRINGWLVTFAVSKVGGSLFVRNSVLSETGWKSAVYEKMARITHLGAYLLAGLAKPSQNVYWITDEDEIAANAAQLTLLTSHIANVFSHFSAFDLGHLRTATTKSDNGDYMIEDICAICDLAAGATGEVLTLLTRENRQISKYFMSPLPTNISWKTKTILYWLSRHSSLRRSTIKIDLDSKGFGVKSQLLTWHSYSSAVSLSTEG